MIIIKAEKNTNREQAIYFKEYMREPLRARVVKTLTCGSGRMETSIEVDHPLHTTASSNSIITEDVPFFPWGWQLLIRDEELAKLPQPPPLKRGFAKSCLAASAAGTGGASRYVAGEWTDIIFDIVPWR